MATGTSGGARTPAALGNMPLRGKQITEDVRAWTDAAHKMQIQMAIEMHTFAILLQRKIKTSGGKTGAVDKFSRASAARRAARPLVRAANQAADAATGVLRFWRSYLHIVTELQAARRGQRRR